MRNLKALKEGFDVVSYLEDLGIDVHDSVEKNVTQGWVNINCPFCGGADPSWHLGIHYEKDNHFNCWICNESGDIIELIQELESVGFQVALNRLEQYQGEVKREEKPGREYRTILPEYFEYIERGKEPAPVKYYLKLRGFDLSICQQYNLGWVPFGEYQMRLIVPVYAKRVGNLRAEIVSFQAMDVTGQAETKYLDCPPGRAEIENKHNLYGVDSIGEQVILVEGVTDKWRLGRDAVALFTKNWTRQQVNLLYERARRKTVKVLLDLDAIRDGKRLAKELSSLWTDIRFIQLEEGDPADPAEFSDELVREVMRA